MNNTPRAIKPRRSSRLSTLCLSMPAATPSADLCQRRLAALALAAALAQALATGPARAQDAATPGAGAPGAGAPVTTQAVTPSDIAGAAIANGAATMPGGARINLATGQKTQLALPVNATYYILSGRDNISLLARNGALEVTPRQEGQARVIIAAPGEPERTYNITILPATPPVDTTAPVAAEAPLATAPVATDNPAATDNTGVVEVPTVTVVAPSSPAPEYYAAPTDTTAPVVAPGAVVEEPPYAAPPVTVPESAPATAVLPPEGGPVVTIDQVSLPAPAQPKTKGSGLNTGALPEVPATPQLLQSTQPVERRAMPVGGLPLPIAGENYPVLHLTQGMAKLIPSGENVLAVFFSNDNVMDARAINARTIAITGKAIGQSTLAIFKARNKKDVVGEPEVYVVDVGPPSPLGQALQNQTPASLESAITTAIADPRIKTSVFTTPNGGYVVRLKGAVRDAAEKQAAERVVELFGLPTASAIYVDPKALTIPEYIAGPLPPEATPTERLQSQLRSITGNSSIALVEWPTGLVMTGTVASPEEAERVLGLVSGIGQRVTSFLRIPGQAGGEEVYQSQVPQLTPEDALMTRHMQAVTGIPTVYAVRTAFNAIAVTGTVRTRSDYDRVKRYASLLPQVQGGAGASAAGGNAATTSDQPSASAGTAPAPVVRDIANLGAGVAPGTGYEFPQQIQMFVRITDPGESQVRQVTIDTNVVEISRTALRNLGVEVGSAQLLSRSVQPGTPPTTTTTTNANGTTTVFSPGTPTVIQSEVDPTFRNGVAVGGNGFGGNGPNGLIDPIRVRLNALFTNGDARILSNPNLTTLEGGEARLIVGGQRPIIRTTVSEGSIAQEVDFRPFGIILAARPTVGGDNTITLQIRADVTELDFGTAINVGGAQIPGERTRSVDTTLVLKPGDTLVMGGLIATERRKEYSRVPLLSKIPILGKLFESKRFVNDETELAIFMTPTLRRIDVSMDEFNGTFMNHPRLPELRPIEGILGPGPGAQGSAGGGTGTPAQSPR